jgi:hypothetical protein
MKIQMKTQMTTDRTTQMTTPDEISEDSPDATWMTTHPTNLIKQTQMTTLYDDTR